MKGVKLRDNLRVRFGDLVTLWQEKKVTKTHKHKISVCKKNINTLQQTLFNDHFPLMDFITSG